MHTKELATPWIRKSPPGICRGAFGPEERETTIDREARLRFLVQSAFYLGIPVSQYDLEKRLLKSWTGPDITRALATKKRIGPNRFRQLDITGEHAIGKTIEEHNDAG